MATSLRDFWFPILLAVVGLLPLFWAGSATGNGKRVLLTSTVLLLGLAALTYIWGDPVRGPFAHLVHPRNPDKFVLHAVVNCTYPVSQLKDGIDFSNCVRLDQNYQPIELWIKRTWWSGLQLKVRLNEIPDGKPYLIFDNKKLRYSKDGVDVNYDDYAFEAVTAEKVPFFQLIIAKNLSAIYLNTIWLSSDGKGIMLLKDNTFARVPMSKANKPKNRLDRIFKYPSYLYQGERR